jgi:hypothetical protein
MVEDTMVIPERFFCAAEISVLDVLRERSPRP